VFQLNINDEFIDKIKKDFKQYNDLAILIAYGDFNNNPDVFSNIFVIFYSESDNNIEKIMNFKNSIYHFFDIKYEILEEKQATFYSKNHLKINFKIKKTFNIDKDKEILEKKGISWNKSVLIRKNYEQKNINDNYINNFINHYDNFYTNFYLGDFISAYKNFNELLYILFDIQGIYNTAEQSKIWYASNHSSRNYLEKLTQASTDLNPNKMITNIKVLSEIFKNYLENSTKEAENIIDILNSIDKKYPHFFNLRDISKIPNSDSEKVILNEGLIYRSASLERYCEKDIEEFMKKNNIIKIIDLRDEEELALYKKNRNTFYSEEFKENYIVNIPVNLTNVNDYFNGDDQLNHYFHFLKTMQKQIKEIFNDHFSKADTEKMIIHCEGGKDRTGIIIAILLDFLGVEKKVIKKDFMTSYHDTSEKLIDLIIDTINQKYGGSEAYLRDYCGISQEVLNSIRKKFILVQKAY
jgi:protein tyrosine/serine phosphatase